MPGIDKNTLLLLHGDSIEDSSQYKVPLTNQGVVTSTAQSKFGGKSLYFDGNSYIDCVLSDCENFTFDWWEFLPSLLTNFGNVFSCQSSNHFLLAYNATRGGISIWDDPWNGYSLDAQITEQWVHRAFVKSGNKLLFFRDGKLIKETSSAQNMMYAVKKLRIGSRYDIETQVWNGYIDEFRISNVARWTSNFTPPTEPYAEEPETPPAPSNFRVSKENGNTVTLSWNASHKADGYRICRDSELIYDGPALTCADITEPFEKYVYSATAYNDIGESETATTIEYTFTPIDPIPYLVTDRTLGDVSMMNSKGTYNFSDLNRVGKAIKFLKEKLESAGYLVPVTPKVDWTDLDWMNSGEAAAYLEYITTVRNALSAKETTPPVPKSMEGLTHTQANDIEQILLDIYNQYKSMLATYVACGVATCGGDYI